MKTITVLNALSQVGMDKGYGLWVGMSSFSGLVTNFMSDAATVVLIGPIVVPMGIMTQLAREPWAVGMAVALASSYAHFLIVGSPANALTFALGVYPDTNKRALEAIDFVKYGFGFFILSMLDMWRSIPSLVFRREFSNRQRKCLKPPPGKRKPKFNVSEFLLFNFQGFGYFYFLSEEVQIGRFFDDIHGAELDGLKTLFLRYVGRQQDDRYVGL